jgi:polysaccharide export outer membrane protein
LENSKLTVLQAVAMAQGANPTASLNNAKVIRTSNGQRQEIPIKLKKILEAKAADTQLQAGDILFIPSSVAKSVTRRSLESALQVATGIAIYRP